MTDCSINTATHTLLKMNGGVHVGGSTLTEKICGAEMMRRKAQDKADGHSAAKYLPEEE